MANQFWTTGTRYNASHHIKSHLMTYDTSHHIISYCPTRVALHVFESSHYTANTITLNNKNENFTFAGHPCAIHERPRQSVITIEADNS